MKKILLFLAGVGLGLLLLLVGTFVYLGRDAAPSIDPKQVLSSAPSFITFNATLEVPPDLKLPDDKDEYRLETRLGGISLVSAQPFSEVQYSLQVFDNPKFPLEISFRVPRKSFFRSPTFDFLVLNAKYQSASAPNVYLTPTTTFGLSWPKLAGWAFVNLSKENLSEESIPSSVDIGRVRFMHSFPVRTSCPEGKTSLAGRIFPAPDSKVNWSGKKIALIVTDYDRRKNIRYSTFASGLSLGELAIHYQLLDFSSGSAAFIVPNRHGGSPYFLLSAIECGAQESVEKCARRAFPIDSIFNNNNILTISEKHYVVPSCGNLNYEGYIGEKRSTAYRFDFIDKTRANPN